MAKQNTRFGLAPSDRVALVAVGGIAVSLLTWLAFAWVTAILRQGQFLIEVFAPDVTQVAMRLGAIVVVLGATLIVQMSYTKRLRIEQQLRTIQMRIQQMYEHSPLAMVSVALDRGVLYANPETLALTGKNAEEFEDAPCHKALWGFSEPCEGCPLEEVLSAKEMRERSVSIEGEDDTRWVDQILYPVFDHKGQVESVVEALRDTTDLHLAEQALMDSHRELEERIADRTADLTEANVRLESEMAERERASDALRDSEERYRRLIESSPDMVLVHRGGNIAFVNTSGARLLGFRAPDEALGLPVAPLWSPNGSGMSDDDLAAIVAEGRALKPTHVLLNRADGHVVDVELSVGTSIYEGDPAVQCVVRDITERIQAQETIERMAYYDSLTGLPNRALFEDRLRQAIAQARRRRETIAVMLVDLDDFKSINDSLGHVVGDGVLKEVARRIHALLREEDTVARQSGDEFTVIARVSELDDAEAVADRILKALAQPVLVDGFELHVSACIGIATYPKDGTHELELVRHADAAMYRAKDWGRNVHRVYSTEMSDAAYDRLELEAALRQALERDEFEVYYQPQIDMRTGQAVGVEALLRWNHPTQGLLAPGVFLELAEQAGFMGEIGHWVLDTACEQAAKWIADGVDFGRVAVNLSAREFVQQDIAGNVARALTRNGLAPQQLELEVTETIAMYNVEQILDILRSLHDIGVRVAIDDFGTGYSSMSYLKRFPIQTLKIAQAFMRDVHVDPQSAAIASMLIELCRELDLDVVAEGVEVDSQLDFLSSRGCYVIQGYIFSRPVTAEEVTVILKEGVQAAI